MKNVALLIALLPGLCWAQTDSLAPQPVALPRPDTLKPVEFREIPYQYSTSSSSYYQGQRHTSYTTHTGIHRIYTYDGIDVADPERTLWPTLLAVNDPDVQRTYADYNGIVERRTTATVMGTLLMVPGLIMMGIGLAQNRDYRNQVAQHNAQYYTVMQQQTTYTTRTCYSWVGMGTGSNTTWTCSTDMSWKYTGENPPITQQVPHTTTVPVTKSYSTSVNPTVSDGRGLMIGGLASTLLGCIIYCTARGDRSGTFLRAVQYYNRALKRSVSWEIHPYSTLGVAGPSLVMRF